MFIGIQGILVGCAYLENICKWQDMSQFVNFP
jgi:hypothetical protein